MAIVQQYRIVLPLDSRKFHPSTVYYAQGRDFRLFKQLSVTDQKPLMMAAIRGLQLREDATDSIPIAYGFKRLAFAELPEYVSHGFPPLPLEH
jgi:hypothetical protein